MIYEGGVGKSTGLLKKLSKKRLSNSRLSNVMKVRWMAKRFKYFRRRLIHLWSKRTQDGSNEPSVIGIAMETETLHFFMLGLATGGKSILFKKSKMKLAGCGQNKRTLDVA